MGKRARAAAWASDPTFDRAFRDSAKQMRALGLAPDDLGLLLGMRVVEASDRARELGLCVRTVDEDSEVVILTGNSIANRLNLSVRSGRVTTILGLG